MEPLALLAKALDVAIWEMGEAFTGMPDNELWVRAHPNLLSVGELAAHVAYGEATHFLGDGFSSPLIQTVARYYSSNIVEPYSLPMSASEVYQEVKRIHEACKASWIANPKSPDELNPHREGHTWGWTLEYQVFHVAYHTGQIYSVRHLLGHETVDN